MFEKGNFGGLFDFDGDGELDFAECLMGFSLFQQILEEVADELDEEENEEKDEEED